LIDAITISDDKERIDKAQKCLDELIKCEKKAARTRSSDVEGLKRQVGKRRNR
jgi:hypothetical protein